MRILLIEADAQLRQQLSLVLQTTGGYEVTPVASAQQAVSPLLSQAFELVLARKDPLVTMPVQLQKIGYGPAPDRLPENCLGWIVQLHPVVGFAEQIRNLWHSQ
ncbi:response regulator transcription factor [Lacimicrobium sp. SS2-24]|uniref:response regulator transcription factor n=1 Tax=Lacimicrobium sp. SS2-24 TaxID=2005569 RepID=UPI000B4A5908|nr:response regulator transcription factor [Lacimicrobium sp. SS2-24]